MSLLSMIGLAKANEYAEGQVWSYKTRPGESSSSVLINKIEANPKLGKIFHISVLNVKVRNPHIASGITTELPHFPVSQETLDKSCLKLLKKSPANKDYLEGYKIWKEAFDKGEAGIFTISIAEIVSFIEKTVNQQ